MSYRSTYEDPSWKVECERILSSLGKGNLARFDWKEALAPRAMRSVPRHAGRPLRCRRNREAKSHMQFFLLRAIPSACAIATLFPPCRRRPHSARPARSRPARPRPARTRPARPGQPIRQPPRPWSDRRPWTNRRYGRGSLRRPLRTTIQNLCARGVFANESNFDASYDAKRTRGRFLAKAAFARSP